MRFLYSLGVLQHCETNDYFTFDDFFIYEDFGDSYLKFSSDSSNSKSTIVDFEKSVIKSVLLNKD